MPQKVHGVSIRSFWSVFQYYPYFNICLSFIALKGKLHAFQPLFITKSCVQHTIYSHPCAPRPWPSGCHGGLHDQSRLPLATPPALGWAFFSQPHCLVLCTQLTSLEGGSLTPHTSASPLPPPAPFSPPICFHCSPGGSSQAQCVNSSPQCWPLSFRVSYSYTSCNLS